MLLLLRGGVCVTVGPTLRSKYEYFVCNDRPPNQPKFRRAFREIRDRPNFETQCAKLWTTPTNNLSLFSPNRRSTNPPDRQEPQLEHRIQARPTLTSNPHSAAYCTIRGGVGDRASMSPRAASPRRGSARWPARRLAVRLVGSPCSSTLARIGSGRVAWGPSESRLASKRVPVGR